MLWLEMGLDVDLISFMSSYDAIIDWLHIS